MLNIYIKEERDMSGISKKIMCTQKLLTCWFINWTWKYCGHLQVYYSYSAMLTDGTYSEEDTIGVNLPKRHFK